MNGRRSDLEAAAAARAHWCSAHRRCRSPDLLVRVGTLCTAPVLAIALLASIMAFVGFSMALALSILLLPLIGAIRAALMHTGYEREDSLLRRTGFRICRRCFHDLSGLPQQGNCPECGAAFVMAEVEEFWSGYANHRDALHGL